VLRELLERPAVNRETRVVEVGCGTGNYLTAIQAATGWVATGIVPAEAMLDQARARRVAVAWLQGRAEALPAADGSADLVFSVDVIHHVGDRDAFFREAMRVLAPGGLVCTATDSEEDIRRRVPLSTHFLETVDFELARYPAIDTLSAEMAAAGFTDIETTHVELAYDLTDAQPYRDRAFSSLHLIPPDALANGLARLERDLAAGPIAALSLYTLLWGRRPGSLGSPTELR
jgi:SAM-dependent methyltransferase